jgi:hypothetical protein
MLQLSSLPAENRQTDHSSFHNTLSQNMVYRSSSLNPAESSASLPSYHTNADTPQASTVTLPEYTEPLVTPLNLQLLAKIETSANDKPPKLPHAELYWEVDPGALESEQVLMTSINTAFTREYNEIIRLSSQYNDNKNYLELVEEFNTSKDIAEKLLAQSDYMIDITNNTLFKAGQYIINRFGLYDDPKDRYYMPRGYGVNSTEEVAAKRYKSFMEIPEIVKESEGRLARLQALSQPTTKDNDKAAKS